MGTTLTGSQINNTYDGLIKTTDNTALSATTKLISDGLGNDSCIKVGTAGTDFLGNVDFSAATVTGLPDNNTTYDLGSAQAGANVSVSLTGSDATTDTVTLAAGTNITLTDNGSCQITIDSTGAAGLVSGTGTDSMKNADSLVTNPATASGVCSIALGDGASAAGNVAVAIGLSASAPLVSGTAVGAYATASSAGTALGNAACAAGGTSVSLGDSSDATGDGSIAIGYQANASATCAVAIGLGVNATTADTVSVKALETQTASTPTAGGIIMTDAGSTARRLNIDASGNLQIDSTPVGGGGGAAGLVAGTGTDSMKNADSLVTVAACANGLGTIALGNNACVSTCTTDTYYSGCGGIAIGCDAQAYVTSDYNFACNIPGMAIGSNAKAISSASGRAIAIGYSACADGSASVALGNSSVTVPDAVAVGDGSKACGGYSINIGRSGCATFYGSVAIGHAACTTAGGFYQGSVAIGNNTQATAVCAVALGVGVNANRVDTVAGNQFEAKTVGKGIVVTSPDGLTTLGIGIDNTGAIVTYTP